MLMKYLRRPLHLVARLNLDAALTLTQNGPQLPLLATTLEASCGFCGGKIACISASAQFTPFAHVCFDRAIRVLLLAFVRQPCAC